MPEDLETLKALIKKGLYFHNLSELISYCDREIHSSKHKLVIFVLREIFNDLKGYYEPPSLTKDEDRILTEGIQQGLLEIIESINQLPNEKLFDLMESFLEKLYNNKSKLS